MTIEEIRRLYAEEIRAVSNLRSEALVEAFATVPRERFLGPGPWKIQCPNPDKPMATSYRPTEDAHPRHLYHNVLVAIDSSRELNNGHPSSLAHWLDALGLKAGDRVFHLGCGVGYYTAIMARVVGPTGHLVAVEIDTELATRAKENLAYLPNVEVLAADGVIHDPGPSVAMFINAGVTHPQSIWLDRLCPQARLMLPLTMTAPTATIPGGSSGFMLKVTRRNGALAARFISPVAIFPCVGGRDPELNDRFRKALATGTWSSVESLRRDAHPADDSCWLHGSEFCLSKAPAGSDPAA